MFLLCKVLTRNIELKFSSGFEVSVVSGPTCDEEGPRVGVDGGQPAEVLPHLLEVLQALVLPPHDGRHPPQRRPLQLLAAVQRVPELEQPDIVLGHVVDEVAGGVDLSQRQLVVILAGRC